MAKSQVLAALSAAILGWAKRLQKCITFARLPELASVRSTSRQSRFALRTTEQVPAAQSHFTAPRDSFRPHMARKRRYSGRQKKKSNRSLY